MKGPKTYSSTINPNQEQIAIRDIARIERLNSAINKATNSGNKEKLEALTKEKQRRCQSLKALADKIYQIIN